MTEQNLGKLESIHAIAPAFLQRAVIVIVLSFIFFLAMMFGFYIRQNIGYFLLSTAFLIVYIFTMFSWVMMRKNIVKIYENGLTYKKFTARWNEIEAVNRYEIRKTKGEKIVLSESIQGVEQIIERIKKEISHE